MSFRGVTTFAALGAGYFLLASLAVSLTRFEGGVAFLWPATALLTAALYCWPRPQWPRALAACAVASALATGLFGLGWAMAAPFVVVNLTEAIVAALLLRPLRGREPVLGSVDWLVRLALAGGLAGPLAAGALATAAGLAVGLEPASTFGHFAAGHALGNLTFLPLMIAIVDYRSSQAMRLPPGRRWGETIVLLSVVAAITALSFAQSRMPLLFLPMLPVILITFRAGRVGAAIALVVVALIGGGLTLSGRGPIHLLDASPGEKVQFLQFYLATLVLTVLPVAADLKRRAELLIKLRDSEERYRMLADHSSDILMHSNVDGRLRYVSPSIRQLGGYEQSDLVGSRPNRFILAADWPLVVAEHQSAVANPGTMRIFEYRVLTRDGKQRWFESHCKAIVDSNGAVEGVISVVRDIHARKESELRLTLAAMTDPLTGLPNRRAFREAAEAAIPNAAGGRQGCIVIIDLDHFKQVNDAHGHDGGDAVLCRFAALAREAVREGDLVARLGGEEFGLLLPGATVEQAIWISERLRDRVAAMAVPGANGMIHVTISGGVAELGEDGLDAAMKNADLALYEAKAGGRDQLALAA